MLDPDAWVLKSVAYVTGVDGPATGNGLELAVPSPNPTQGETAFGFALPRAGDVDLEIVDAAGRRVARLQHGVPPAGEHTLRWSGRADGGRVLGPGVYWASLEFQGERPSRRIAIMN